MKEHSCPLVSIIIPCYNGEQCLSRMLDSVLAQTYRPIEFILVNDGSTDGTLALAESYRERFQSAGISYMIVSQKNTGLGGAINAGLKRFQGDYLCWADADDYYEPTSIEERVKALEEHPESAVVSSDAYIRDCNQLNTVQKRLSQGLKYLDDPNQFEHHLNGDSIFCSGCHMVRTSAFLDVNPERTIFPARRGQNWQMLLPLYFRYKWVFLDKPLYNNIIYPNSMSRDRNCVEDKIVRFNEHEEILNRALDHIERTENVDLSEYRNSVADRYSRYRLEAYLAFDEKEKFRLEYQKKRETTGLDSRDRMAYLRMKSVAFRRLYYYIRRKLRRKE